MTKYSTKKLKFPGSAAITVEFRAVATPAQVELFETSVAAGYDWTSTNEEAYHGEWRLYANKHDVLYFNRATKCAVAAR